MSFLIDSNIIIYAIKPGNQKLREFIQNTVPKVSFVNKIEILGYYNISKDEIELLDLFFSSTEVLLVSEPIIEKAIHLRQRRKMSLADSIIAATVIQNDLTLLTHNTSDFEWIAELKIMDPLIQLDE